MNIRIIPCLLLQGSGLVKTKNFKNAKYIGDPINTVKIFNDKEVDEIIFLDILATNERKSPNLEIIKSIASEAFMPFGYGGGITKISEIEKLFTLGVEKVIINTAAYENPKLISDAAKIFGNQSIVVSIDVKINWLGKYEVWTHSGKKNTKENPVDFVRRIQDLGAGEIFLNSIDRDGTFLGFEIKLIKKISSSIKIPLIACGGAKSISDFKLAVKVGGASAVAAGSMFVFQGIHRAVLISYPSVLELEKAFTDYDN